MNPSLLYLRIINFFKTQRDAEDFLPKLVLSLILFIFIVLVLRTAWMSDDSYFSFRTVDNFINGYGLRWNINERVQVFTHVLWVLLVSVVYFFTHEIYYSVTILSVLLAATAVYILFFKISRSFLSSILLAIPLLFSRAFIDYSTSGLENSLSYFLIAVYALLLFREKYTLKSFFYLSLVASLIILNRFDYIVLLAPSLIYAYCSLREWKNGIKVGLLGFIPLFAWLIFSTIYYGFPFPNTYYAKLHTGIPALEYFEQGIYYFFNLIDFDLITLFVIVATLLYAFFARIPRFFFAALGIAFYLLYILKIGGDFMGGRFFAIPFFFSLCLLAFYLPKKISNTPFIILGSLLFILAYSSHNTSLFTDSQYNPSVNQIDQRGIADERGFYYKDTGLFTSARTTHPPANYHYVKEASLVKSANLSGIDVHNNGGFYGFYIGSDINILDRHGLTDPLIARMKVRAGEVHRIGHFERNIPEGYIMTRLTGKNSIEDPQISKYYDGLKLITQGEDLFSLERLRQIFLYNIGAYDYLLDNTGYIANDKLMENTPANLFVDDQFNKYVFYNDKLTGAATFATYENYLDYLNRLKSATEPLKKAKQ